MSINPIGKKQATNLLKEYMNENHLDSSAIAKKLNVQTCFISNFLNGNYIMTGGPVCQKIYNLLNIEIPDSEKIPYKEGKQVNSKKVDNEYTQKRRDLEAKIEEKNLRSLHEI